MSAVQTSALGSVRPMRERDLPDVHGVESAAYEFPWSENVFRDCIRAGYSCWVLIYEDAICGYGIMSAVAGEAHILNLCIGPHVQRRGLGEQLLRHLCSVAAEHKTDTVLLEVRPSNHTALRLYERHGFGRIGIRRGYYPDAGGREDAFVLALRLSQADWVR
ncbi:MAG: ribosomal protein S18-alanine N-acetyltransferase [Gammaproteobacteria bacterium]|nr:ribosomal protein S18-alanine N-acetyltransferase [Gammaproteobacteria bacterium]